MISDDLQILFVFCFVLFLFNKRHWSFVAYTEIFHEIKTDLCIYSNRPNVFIFLYYYLYGINSINHIKYHMILQLRLHLVPKYMQKIVKEVL